MLAAILILIFLVTDIVVRFLTMVLRAKRPPTTFVVITGRET